MGTIVQDYGPIYGEVVNGTVSGRPNGSVYVPLSNTIQILNDPSGATIGRTNPSKPTRVNMSALVDISAEAQDLTSYIQIQLFSDSDCTTAFGTPRTITAGLFSLSTGWVSNSDEDPVSETTYYLRVQLLNNGTAVATSDVVEVVGL